MDTTYQTCRKFYYAEIKFDMDKTFYYLLKCFSSTELRYQMKNVNLHIFFLHFFCFIVCISFRFKEKLIFKNQNHVFFWFSLVSFINVLSRTLYWRGHQFGTLSSSITVCTFKEMFGRSQEPSSLILLGKNHWP